MNTVISLSVTDAQIVKACDSRPLPAFVLSCSTCDTVQVPPKIEPPDRSNPARCHPMAAEATQQLAPPITAPTADDISVQESRK